MKITATVPMSHDHHVIDAVHLLFLPVRAGLPAWPIPADDCTIR